LISLNRQIVATLFRFNNLTIHSVSRVEFRFTRARENFFDDSFTRVTGLIVQVRRGKANFFLTFFMQNLS